MASLLPGDLVQMRQMIMDGHVPSDIAERFHIAVSSVHYHKGKMKEEGLEPPNVKGKRPSHQEIGQTGYTSPVNNYQSPVSSNPSQQYQAPGHHQTEQPQAVSVPKSSTKKISINGIPIELDPSVSSVKVHPDGTYEIKF